MIPTVDNQLAHLVTSLKETYHIDVLRLLSDEVGFWQDLFAEHVEEGEVSGAELAMGEALMNMDLANSVQSALGQQPRWDVQEETSDMKAKLAELPDFDDEEGDDLCDHCMRSGVAISMTDEKGMTMCSACAEHRET